MPIKLALDNLPEHFTLVSTQENGRDAVVSYPEVVPPHGLIQQLMDTTQARSVGVLTPFKNGKMHFALSSTRGPAYEDRDDILDI